MTVFAVLPIDREPARVYAWDGQTLRHADATRDSLPAALQQLGHSGEAVTLLLSTCDCYSVWHAGDTRGRRPEQLAYLIEPALPVPAEDLAVAAVTSAEGAMVVAARRERVLPWLEACASIGVSRVVPLTLAAAQANATPDQSGAILVGGDVVELRNGKPVAWRWGDDDTPNNIIVARGEDATEALACEWIRRSAARGGACWGDVAGALRAQPAGRRPATLGAGTGRWLMASVAVMLLSTTLALWRGAAGLDHHAEHYQAQTEQAYRRLFPRGSVPAEVPMVLRAELRRRGDS